MHRRVGAFAGTALAVAALTLPSARPAAAATTWTSTATQGLTLSNATSLGALPASTPLNISVALSLRNRPALDQYIRSINTPGDPLYGQSLTPDQFAATYGPTSDQVRAVTDYLTGDGLTNVQAEPNNLFVTAQGTAAQIETAFNTSIGQFQQDGATVYANTTPAQAPSALSGTVVAVLGLNNASRLSSPLIKRGASATVPVNLNGFHPRDYWKAYDAGSTRTASGTSTAIFAEGDLTQVVKDLATERAADGLPAVPYTIVPVGIHSPDTAGAGEWDLDTQSSSGIAGTVNHLYIYDATSLTDNDVALGFNRFVSQDVAKAGSASFGECDLFPYLDGFMVSGDQIFAEAAAQGQTVFASSGDTGMSCAVAPTNGVPGSGPVDTEYPASSPYVVGVGGTTLLTNPQPNTTYVTETAWLGGGGGVSPFETAPFWQTGVAPATTASVQGGRAVPDIAMDADPNTGAVIYVNGQPTQIGGTSLASPLSLGVWARLETNHSNRIGFGALPLYHVYGSPGFHDVIAGSNGFYPATPGYDLATGLGTFDIAKMNTVIAP